MIDPMLTKISSEEFYSDEALQREGVEALQRYSVDLFESHDTFESFSREMCDNEPKWYAEDFIEGLNNNIMEDEDEWRVRAFE
jgi:hypothetical protein